MQFMFDTAMERVFIAQSGRIGLSILMREDVPEIWKISTDSETNRFLNVRWRALHIEDEYEWYEASRKDVSQRMFAIVSKNEDKMVGAIFLHELDLFNRKCHIGYVLDKEYWGRGITTEAVDLLKSYCFGELNLRKLYTSVFETNIASIRVLEKTGFNNIGSYSSHVFIPQKGFVSELLYEVFSEQADQ